MWGAASIQTGEALYRRHHTVNSSWIQYQTEMVVIVFVLTLLAHTRACVFPEFVQSNGTGMVRDWKGHIKAQNTDAALRINFQGGAMHTVSKDPSIPDFYRLCLQTLSDNKFVIEHRERGRTNGKKYRCMQIISKSTGVIQLKTSVLSVEPEEDLCREDQLQQDDWVILDMANIHQHQQHCSIQGGYDMNIFDKQSYRTVCDGYKGETRLESECEPGSSLNFYFRRTSCVPDGLYMYSTQNLKCLANWQDDTWNFILLKHDLMSYMWIFRYPMIYNEKFTAHIFKDLVADTGRAISQSQNYVRLDMTRDPPQLLTSLCADDYEVCSLWKDPCAYGNDMALTCSKTCGVCNDSRPVTCTFDESMRGQWEDASQLGGVSVTINSTSLTVHGYETLHCVQWPSTLDTPASDHNGGGRQVEKMLVAVSALGCRPRYSCAKIRQSSPSVIFFQLSQSKRWPLVDSVSEDISCRGFSYDVDTSIPKTKYRSRHLKALISANTRHADIYVACDMATFVTFDVLFRDNSHCSGMLLQPDTKDRIELNLTDCERQGLHSKIPLEHNCLEHTRLSQEMLVVTRSVGDSPAIYCWIIPKRPKHTFYMVEVGQCNEMTRRRIRKGRLRPFASFSKPRRHVTRTSIVVDKDTPIIYNYTDIIIEGPGLDVASRPDIEWTRNGTNTTHTDGSSHTSSSPYVVAAVIITFMVFQIPCLCKARGS